MVSAQTPRRSWVSRRWSLAFCDLYGFQFTETATAIVAAWSEFRSRRRTLVSCCFIGAGGFVAVKFVLRSWVILLPIFAQLRRVGQDVLELFMRWSSEPMHKRRLPRLTSPHLLPKRWRRRRRPGGYGGSPAYARSPCDPSAKSVQLG